MLSAQSLRDTATLRFETNTSLREKLATAREFSEKSDGLPYGFKEGAATITIDGDATVIAFRDAPVHDYLMMARYVSREDGGRPCRFHLRRDFVEVRADPPAASLVD